MICALLLGREGSSGFPGKNVYPVLGRPLVAYPLLAAGGAASVDRVYLSTDSPTLKRIGTEYGARIIDRPAHLASKEALGEDAYVHGYQTIAQQLAAEGEHVELMVLLFANAATVVSATIDEGIDVLRRNPDLDSAVTVSCYNMWSPLRARQDRRRRPAASVRAVRDLRRPENAQLRSRFAGRRLVRGHGIVDRPAAVSRQHARRSAAAEVDGTEDSSVEAVGRPRRRLRMADSAGRALAARSRRRDDGRTMIAALICGRADGSKFPSRNTFPLFGRPLMLYASLAALHASEVEHVFLTSDDEGMKRVARHHGIRAIDRPEALSGEAVPLEEVVRHGYNEIRNVLGEDLEALVIVLANAPTVTSEQIDQGVHMLRADATLTAVISASAHDEFHPSYALCITEKAGCAGMPRPAARTAPSRSIFRTRCCGWFGPPPSSSAAAPRDGWSTWSRAASHRSCTRGMATSTIPGRSRSSKTGCAATASTRRRHRTTCCKPRPAAVAAPVQTPAARTSAGRRVLITTVPFGVQRQPLDLLEADRRRVRHQPDRPAIEGGGARDAGCRFRRVDRGDRADYRAGDGRGAAAEADLARWRRARQRRPRGGSRARHHGQLYAGSAVAGGRRAGRRPHARPPAGHPGRRPRDARRRVAADNGAPAVEHDRGRDWRRADRQASDPALMRRLSGRAYSGERRQPRSRIRQPL